MRTGKQASYNPLMYPILVKKVLEGKMKLSQVKEILGESQYKKWVEEYYQAAVDIKELSNRCKLMILLRTSYEDMAKTFIELNKKRTAFLNNVEKSLIKNNQLNSTKSRVAAVGLVNKAIETSFELIESKGLDVAMATANDPRMGPGYVRDILLSTIEFKKAEIAVNYYKNILGEK